MKSERAVLGVTMAALIVLNLIFLSVNHPNALMSLVQQIGLICLIAFTTITFAAAALQNPDAPVRKRFTEEEPTQHPSWFFSNWEK